MHHNPTAAHVSGDEDESRPFFAPSSSATLASASAQTNVRTPSPSSSISSFAGPYYQSVSRSPSPKKKRTNPSSSTPNALHREETDLSLPGSGSGSGSSTSSSSSEDEEEEQQQQGTTDHTRLQRPSHQHRPHHHHHHRYTQVQKMLAVVAQLGLFIYFGTLIGVTAKAPWVYPYSWHPICMGLYGFVATEGILLLQPTEKSKQRALARTVHGVLLSLALVSAVIGFVAIYVNKDRLNKTLFGLSVAYAPRSLYRKIGQARITRIHRVSGYISITLMWGTLWLAVVTNWVKKNFDQEWIFYLGLGMVAVGLVGQITPSRLYLTPKRTSSIAPTAAP
ncbi:Serine--tRNA ligase, mitochondrial [Mortierella sp. GBA35]|nr:Serine--tRNA ligase, mitochondrial [Mortierella sp. GBA35]